VFGGFEFGIEKRCIVALGVRRGCLRLLDQRCRELGLKREAKDGDIVQAGKKEGER